MSCISLLLRSVGSLEKREGISSLADLADCLVCPAAILSTSQCPFNLTVTEPAEELGSLGNNPGIISIASRLEPN